MGNDQFAAKLLFVLLPKLTEAGSISDHFIVYPMNLRIESGYWLPGVDERGDLFIFARTVPCRKRDLYDPGLPLEEKAGRFDVDNEEVFFSLLSLRSQRERPLRVMIPDPTRTFILS